MIPMSGHVTCGRGTELFAKAELQEKLNCNVISVEDGKVFFSMADRAAEGAGRTPQSDNDYRSQLFNLKTVERLFATVTHFPTADIKGNGKVKFLHALKNRILDGASMKEAVNTTRKLRVLQNACTPNHRWTQRSCEDCGQGAAESPLQVNYDGDQTSTCEADNNHRSTCSCCCEHYHKENTRNITTGRKREVQIIDVGMVSDDDDEIQSEPPVKLRRCECTCTSVTGEDRHTARCTEENREVRAREVRRASTTKQSSCSPDEGKEDASVSFRFSVKCGGWCKKWLQPQRLAKELAVRLTIMTGWAVDLRSPDIEICIHINDDFVTAGIPLTRVPLSKRDYIQDAGLRSTISWIMARQADIQPGHWVVDPMCGKATILLEAAREHPQVGGVVGCDIDPHQLQAAHRNVRHAGLGQSVQLIHADTLRLPLRTGSVDRVVCDAPFGNKFTVAPCALPHFYRRMMQEMHRVLAPEGLAVLLTSAELLPVVQENCRAALRREPTIHSDSTIPRKTSTRHNVNRSQEETLSAPTGLDSKTSTMHDVERVEVVDSQISAEYDVERTEVVDSQLSAVHDVERTELVDSKTSSIHVERREAVDSQTSAEYDVERTEVVDSQTSAVHDVERIKEVDWKTSSMHVERTEVVGSKPSAIPVERTEVVGSKPSAIPVERTEVVDSKPSAIPVERTEVVGSKLSAIPVERTEVVGSKPSAIPVEMTEVVGSKPSAIPVERTEVVDSKPSAIPVERTEVVGSKPSAIPVERTEVVGSKPSAIPVEMTEVVGSKPSAIHVERTESVQQLSDHTPPCQQTTGNENLAGFVGPDCGCKLIITMGEQPSETDDVSERRVSSGQTSAKRHSDGTAAFSEKQAKAEHVTENSQIFNEEQTRAELKTDNKFGLLSQHYVKLGETHAYIVVLQKSAVCETG